MINRPSTSAAARWLTRRRGDDEATSSMGEEYPVRIRTITNQNGNETRDRSHVPLRNCFTPLPGKRRLFPGRGVPVASRGATVLRCNFLGGMVLRCNFFGGNLLPSRAKRRNVLICVLGFQPNPGFGSLQKWRPKKLNYRRISPRWEAPGGRPLVR